MLHFPLRKRFDYGAVGAVGLAKVLPSTTGTDNTPVHQMRGISVTLGSFFKHA